MARPCAGMLVLALLVVADFFGRAPAAGRAAEPDFREATCNQLVRQLRWTEPAAKAFVTGNEAYLAKAHAADAAALAKSLGVLGRLAEKRYWQEAIAREPMLAGLLAIAYEAGGADGPRRVLASLPREREDRDLALSLYGLFSAPQDLLRLAELLEDYGDLPSRLYKRDALDLIAYLPTRDDRQGPLTADQAAANDAKKTHVRWVKRVLADALQSSDQHALNEARVVFAIHSDEVARLAAEPRYAAALLDELWPRFRELLASAEHDVTWANYVSDPRVWRFLLEHPDDLELFRRHGVLTFDLLFSDLPAALRDKARVALAKDELALTQSDAALLRLLDRHEVASDDRFQKLFRRKMPEATLRKTFIELDATGDNGWGEKLEFYHGLSDGALTEELGEAPEGAVTWLPGYSIYYLGRKSWQGRPVTGLDVAFAAWDAVDIAITVGTVGVGSVVTKGGGTAIKEGAKVAGKEAFKEGGEQVAKNIIKRGVKELSEEVAKEGSRQAAQRLTLAAARKSIAKFAQAAAEFTYVDVTDLVREAFKRSGLKLQDFKKLTRLDARIFMRRDRRVYFNVSGAAVSAMAEVLQHTAKEAAKDAQEKVVETVVEETAKTVVGKEDAARLKEAALVAWEANLSLWWLAQALGPTAP